MATDINAGGPGSGRKPSASPREILKKHGWGFAGWHNDDVKTFANKAYPSHTLFVSPNGIWNHVSTNLFDNEPKVHGSGKDNNDLAKHLAKFAQNNKKIDEKWAASHENLIVSALSKLDKQRIIEAGITRGTDKLHNFLKPSAVDPEVQAYRDIIDGHNKLARDIIQAHAQEVMQDPKELWSSQPDIYREAVEFFIWNPREINTPQRTLRYGGKRNKGQEIAVVGITSEGRKYAIDGNHRSNAALLLGRKVKAKQIYLPEILLAYREPIDIQAFGTHEGAVLGWEHRARAAHPNAKYFKVIRGFPYAKEKPRGGEKRYHLFDPTNGETLGVYHGKEGKLQMKLDIKNKDFPNKRNPVKVDDKTNVPAPRQLIRELGSTDRALLDKEISENRNLGGGINETRILKFADGTKAIFKPKDGEYKGNIRDGIKDNQMAREIAAYRVARLVGVQDLVPTVAERVVDGKPGAVMEFREGVTHRSEDRVPVENRIRAGIFDFVMGNTDRHGGNYLITNDGKLSLIDNGLTLSEEKYHRYNMRGFLLGGYDNYDANKDKPVRQDLVKPYVDNLDKIDSDLRALKIPRAAIDNMRERVYKLRDAKTYGEIWD